VQYGLNAATIVPDLQGLVVAAGHVVAESDALAAENECLVALEMRDAFSIKRPQLHGFVVRRS
jgi:hypothetical protein